MGSNALIELRPDTRIQDVLTVMAALNGATMIRRSFSGSDDWSTDFEGYKAKISLSAHPAVLDIRIQNSLIDRAHDGSGVWFSYRFEADRGSRVMFPPSTPYWIAVGGRLVKIFGGKILCSDTADKPKVFKSAGLMPKASRSNNKVYYKAQEVLMGVSMLTLEEIETCSKFAAHSETYKILNRAIDEHVKSW